LATKLRRAELFLSFPPPRLPAGLFLFIPADLPIFSNFCEICEKNFPKSSVIVGLRARAGVQPGPGGLAAAP
jgi:hypothetical protein